MVDNKFEPSSPFEGFLKGNIDEIFRQNTDIKKDIASLNNDFVFLKTEFMKEVNDLKTKVSGIKGWILAISLGFGFVGGIISFLLVQLFHLQSLIK